MIENITLKTLLQHYAPNLQEDDIQQWVQNLSPEATEENILALFQQEKGHLDNLTNLYLILGAAVALSFIPGLAVIKTTFLLSKFSPKNIAAIFRKFFPKKELPLQQEEDLCHALAMVNLLSVCMTYTEDPSGNSNFQWIKELTLYEPGYSFITEIIGPINSRYVFEKPKNEVRLNNLQSYQSAYSLAMVKEFPEFLQWIDLRLLLQQSQKMDSLLEGQEETKLLIQEMQEAQRSMSKTSFRLSPTDLKKLEDLFSEDAVYWELLEKHHDQLKKWLVTPLLDRDLKDVSSTSDQVEEDVDFPENGKIFLPHAYHKLYYDPERDKEEYLKTEYWEEDNPAVTTGENVLNELERLLLQPDSARRPILILGNPGAGKSFLSEYLAAQLASREDFVPLHIRFRDLQTESVDFSTHINKGLRNLYGESREWDWFTLSHKLKDRKFTILLDGFDELLKASPQELRHYVKSVTDSMRNCAEMHGISIRVIITSRLNLMRGMEIVKYTPILRLQNFKQTQWEKWCDVWNETQQGLSKKHYLKIPQSHEIRQFAEEPVLLLLLALYHGKGNHLTKLMEQPDLNQVKLYHALITQFIKRQVHKRDEYKDSSLSHLCSSQDSNFNLDCQKFRFEVGLVAFAMFHTDSTTLSREELAPYQKAFGLELCHQRSQAGKGVDIFDEFMFLHKNQAITDLGDQARVYEFLHRTFGEFLAADFILQVAQATKQHPVKVASKDSAFRFILGSQWIAKDTKMLSLFLDHAPQLEFQPDKIDEIEEVLQEDIEKIYKGGSEAIRFPIDKYPIDHSTEMEQQACYSQNLFLLWLALVGESRPLTLPNIKSSSNRAWRWLIGFWVHHNSPTINRISRFYWMHLANYNPEELHFKESGLHQQETMQSYEDYSFYLKHYGLDRILIRKGRKRYIQILLEAGMLCPMPEDSNEMKIMRVPVQDLLRIPIGDWDFEQDYPLLLECIEQNGHWEKYYAWINQFLQISILLPSEFYHKLTDRMISNPLTEPGIFNLISLLAVKAQDLLPEDFEAILAKIIPVVADALSGYLWGVNEYLIRFLVASHHSTKRNEYLGLLEKPTLHLIQDFTSHVIMPHNRAWRVDLKQVILLLFQLRSLGIYPKIQKFILEWKIKTEDLDANEMIHLTPLLQIQKEYREGKLVVEG